MSPSFHLEHKGYSERAFIYRNRSNTVEASIKAS